MKRKLFFRFVVTVSEELLFFLEKNSYLSKLNSKVFEVRERCNARTFFSIQSKRTTKEKIRLHAQIKIKK